MKKNNNLYERNDMPTSFNMHMNYIKGQTAAYGSSTSSSSKSSVQAGDIYIIKKDLAQINTGMLQISIPENFELFNVQYSAEETTSHFDRKIYAIYTFTRIKINNTRLEI